MAGRSSTSRTAILFGIPTTREEFDAVTTSSFRSDYMTGMLRGNDPASVWKTDYMAVSQAAVHLVEAAKGLGVEVYPRATLDEFADVTKRLEFIVLFAHWRGAAFQATDFSGDLDKVFERIKEHPAVRLVEADRGNVKAIVEALNAAIENLSLLQELPPALAEAGRKTRVIGQTLCRDLMDEALLGLVEPGNKVELFDGLHSPADLDFALSPEFSGELDLALCNSEALARFIDLRRGEAVRHLHWPTLLHPLPQLLKVEKTLQLMSIHGSGYIDTRLSIEESE